MVFILLQTSSFQRLPWGRPAGKPQMLLSGFELSRNRVSPDVLFCVWPLSSLQDCDYAGRRADPFQGCIVFHCLLAFLAVSHHSFNFHLPDFPDGSDGEESSCSAEAQGLILGLGEIP